MTEEPKCTPGCEWSCGTAASYYCHCNCGGANHGQFRHLADERNATGPWTAHEARVVLEAARLDRSRARAIKKSMSVP